MMLSLSIALCAIGMIFLFFFVAIGRILYPILFPTIIPYPYPPPPPPPSYQQRPERTVVFAGSFNPIHMGHLAMIQQYIIQHYSKVIIVIGTNPRKRYAVSAQERANLIRKVIRHSNNKFMIQNIIVQVVSDDYIWRIVKRQGASLFLRGIRTWEQDGRDERKLQFQNIYGPIILGPLWYPIPTIFMQGSPQYNHISSTYLRNLIQQYAATAQRTEPAGEQKGAQPKQQQQQQQQQRQAEQLQQVLRKKLVTLVPEPIVDDVIQLYGVTNSTAHFTTSKGSIDTGSTVSTKDKSI